MRRFLVIKFLFFLFFIITTGCRNYKSLEPNNKEIKSLEESTFKKLVSQMRPNETYKIKTDSATFNFVYLNYNKEKFVGYKKNKKEDTLALYKENMIFVKESRFSSLKTDLFTVSTYLYPTKAASAIFKYKS